MVDDSHHADHERHAREGQPAGRRAEAAEEAEREGREVVRDLGLRQLGRAEPDDRQDAEEPEPQPGADAARRERRRDREHPHVDAEVGDHEVAPAVPGEVEAEREDGDRDEVDEVQDGLGHEASGCRGAGRRGRGRSHSAGGVCAVAVEGTGRVYESRSAGSRPSFTCVGAPARLS